jgi:hypothetical protein
MKKRRIGTSRPVPLKKVGRKKSLNPRKYKVLLSLTLDEYNALLEKAASARLSTSVFVRQKFFDASGNIIE